MVVVTNLQELDRVFLWRPLHSIWNTDDRSPTMEIMPLPTEAATAHRHCRLCCPMQPVLRFSCCEEPFLHLVSVLCVKIQGEFQDLRRLKVKAKSNDFYRDRLIPFLFLKMYSRWL